MKNFIGIIALLSLLQWFGVVSEQRSLEALAIVTLLTVCLAFEQLQSIRGSLNVIEEKLGVSQNQIYESLTHD